MIGFEPSCSVNNLDFQKLFFFLRERERNRTLLKSHLFEKLLPGFSDPTYYTELVLE